MTLRGCAAAAAAVAWLGCSSQPFLSGIGEASPPGLNRNDSPSPVATVLATAPTADSGSAPNAPVEPTETPAREAPESAVWEDPSGRLFPVQQAFRTLQRPLRVVQFGDSHTEGDAFPGALRRRLWAQLGDGGRGFVPVAGDQWDVTRTLSGPWRVVRSGLRPSGGPNGLGLSRVIATSPDATLRVETCTRCPGGQSADRITVFFRVVSDGGHLLVGVDRSAPRRVSTRATGSMVIEVPDAPHAVTVRPEGDGTVEVYGVALDRQGGGARLEAAGVVGAQAIHLRDEDWTVLSQHLADRAPSLVVFAFGTNESVSSRRDPAAHAAALTTLAERVRASVPTAALAFFGPPDTELRSTARPGAYVPAPRLGGVIDAARSTASQSGAWFVDLRALMGGSGAVHSWATERPPRAEPDHVHLTARGYARLAGSLADALLGPPATVEASPP